MLIFHEESMIDTGVRNDLSYLFISISVYQHISKKDESHESYFLP